MDLRLAGLASVLTALAVADTILPTPEDAFPILGWFDEVTLWGLSIKAWIDFLSNKTLEDYVWMLKG